MTRLTSQIGTRFIKQDGVDATLRTFSKSGVDKQGDDTFTETDTTVKVIKGFGTNTRMPEILYTAMGNSRPMDYEFIILEEDAPDQPETTGKLPKLILGKRSYRILEVEPLKIGFSRLLCESTREHKGA